MEFNKSDNLPFGLFDPTLEGKLTWICANGPTGDIVSVFTMDFGDHKEKKTEILKDEEQARFFRDELLKANWKVLIPPKVSFTTTNPDGSKREGLTRKQKRFIQRQIERFEKSAEQRVPHIEEADEDEDE